jgi:hypothetical protein
MLAGATVKELGKSLLRRRHWLRVRNLLGYPSKYSKGRWGVESRGGESTREDVLFDEFVWFGANGEFCG